MFICNEYQTVMFSSIESFTAQKNYKGGDWGSLWVKTKTGEEILFHYSEFDNPERRKREVEERVRKAMLENKPIRF